MIKESIFNNEKKEIIFFGGPRVKPNTKVLNQKSFVYIAKR